MSDNFQLVYSLEIKVLDLEKKLNDLEVELQKLRKQVQTVDDDAPANVPDEVLEKIEEGESAVRVLRQFRLMTQKELGELCGIRPNHISAMERGMSYGLKTAKRLAKALDVPVDLLT